MTRWLPARLALALPLLLAGAAAAETPPLEDITAFERGFAVSLYQFDACGDALAGRMFRRALAERFAQCPFSAAARERFARRSAAELARTRQIMTTRIDAEGGLPHRLEGMEATCHAHQEAAEYRALRARLEAYAAGSVPATAILPAPCDAAEILP